MAVSPFRRFVGRVAAGALALAVPVVLTPPRGVGSHRPTCSSPSTSRARATTRPSRSTTAPAPPSTSPPAATPCRCYSNGVADGRAPPIDLTGTVASGDVHVVAQPRPTPAILGAADQTDRRRSSSTVTTRSPCARARRVLDVFGQIGFDPGARRGASGPTSTADHTLRRKATVCAGDPDGTRRLRPGRRSGTASPSTPSTASAPTAATCGAAARRRGPRASQASTRPPAPPSRSTPTVVVTFSEPVTRPGLGLHADLRRRPGGLRRHRWPDRRSPSTRPPPSRSARPARVTVTRRPVSDVDTNDPPDTVAADCTSAFSVARTSTAARRPPPITTARSRAPATTAAGRRPDAHRPRRRRRRLRGRRSPRCAASTCRTPGRRRRRHLRRASSSSTAATDLVDLGDVVTVTGTVGEFQGQTQIVGATSTSPCAAPAHGRRRPTSTLPVASADRPRERTRACSSRLPQDARRDRALPARPLRPGRRVGRRPARRSRPTSSRPARRPARSRPRTTSTRSSSTTRRNAQNPDPILFGRGGQPLSASNTLRGGDTVTGVTGVMTYTWGGNAAEPATPTASGRSTRSVARSTSSRPTRARRARRAVGGDVAVGGDEPAQLLQHLRPAAPAGVGGAAHRLPRRRQPGGVRPAVAQDRRRHHQVNADVLGVNEIENDGYGPDSAIQTSSTGSTTRTAPGTYAFIDVDAATGQVDALGTDAIKVGMIYKPAAVTPVGHTAVAQHRGVRQRRRHRPAQPAVARPGLRGQRDRRRLRRRRQPPQVQGLARARAPDAGDGQGNCNAVRTNAAQRARRPGWPPTRRAPATTDVLILGDLNSYAKEDPITRPRGRPGYTNLVDAVRRRRRVLVRLRRAVGLPRPRARQRRHRCGAGHRRRRVPHQRRRAVGPRLQHRLQDAGAGRQPLRAGRVPRLRPRPGLVGLKPNSAPTVSAAFVDGSVGVRHGQREPDASSSPTATAADTHSAIVAWGDGTRGHDRRPGTSPLTVGHTYAQAGCTRPRSP